MRSRWGIAAALVLWTGLSCAQYQVALPGYAYQFPRDHFNHPAYQTEWWYYTGNLKAADGHRFGFELTFFRQGMNGKAAEGTWSVRELYFAHLALSDLDGGSFYHTERFNRQGPGLAGASLEQGRVWNGNWQVQWVGEQQELRGVAEKFGIELKLVSRKPPVIHGENGISQKGAGEGHASHYISLTRLLAHGSVELSGKVYKVEGTVWMDHEFSTNSMAADEVGWDWMGLQLDDNTELMLYRMRHKDGSVDPFSSGTYVDAEGHATHLGLGDFTMQPAGKTWTSQVSGAVYPVAWNLEIRRYGLALQVRTDLVAQELTGRTRYSPSYWEGAVAIAGSRNASPISGVGYLEMTGYNGALPLSGQSRQSP